MGLGVHHVSFASRYHSLDAELFQDYGLQPVPPPVEFPLPGSVHNIVRGIRFLISLVVSSINVGLWRLFPTLGRRLALIWNAGLAEFLAADGYVLAGGGYLYSARRSFNLTLYHCISVIWLARVSAKPIISMPISIGPWTRRLDRMLARVALRRCGQLVARDQSTFDALRLSGGTLTRCPDVAFIERQHDVLHRKRKVAIVAMDWTWARHGANHSALDEYIERLAGACRELAQNGVEVSILGHSRMPEQGQDDQAVASRLFQVVGDRGGAVELLDVKTVAEVQSTMAECRAAICSRLHSAIIGLRSGTPTIALSYQPKTAGTFQWLGLEDWCLDIEDFTPWQLIELVGLIDRDPVASRDVVELAVKGARDWIWHTYCDLHV